MCSCGREIRHAHTDSGADYSHRCRWHQPRAQFRPSEHARNLCAPHRPRAGAKGITISLCDAFLCDIEKLIRMSIPAIDHPSLTQRARQSARPSHSMRPSAHALGNQRYREDKPRHQDRHEQQRKVPRRLPAFLHHNEGIKTLEKKANPIRLRANGQFER